MVNCFFFLFQMLFNNITVICQSRLSYTATMSSKMYEVFFIKKHFVDLQYLDLLGVKNFVNVVEGHITKINRKEKSICINDTHQIKYDKLFLMCGEIFTKPLRFNKYPFKEKPENVFIINSHIDANKALSKLKQLKMKNKSQCKCDKIDL